MQAPPQEPLSVPKIRRGQELSLTDAYLQTPYPYNPDTLVGKKGLAIYRKMLEDEQVKAALSAKKFAALSTGYEIKPVENPEKSARTPKVGSPQDKLGASKNGNGNGKAKEEKEFQAVGKPTPDSAADKQAEEVSRFVEFNLNELEGTFDARLYEILSALDFGYSVTEQVFWLIDYGEFEGKVGLKALKTRKPDGIDFDIDAYGNLLPDGVLQAQRRMSANKFLIYSYRKAFSNYYGNSDLRECYRAWWSKDATMRFFTMALERYGHPIPIFKPAGTMTPDQRASAQAFIDNLQAKTGLILPAGIEFEFESGQTRAAEAFVPALQLLDTQIRVGLLMPGLMGLSAEKETGSFARSETEFDVFVWILKYIRKDLETLINEYLIKPLVDLNYEVKDGKYPTFAFKEITQEHKERLLKMWLEALAGKAVTPTREDEDITRELMDRPELPEDVKSDAERAQENADVAQEQQESMLEASKISNEMSQLQPAQAGGKENSKLPPKPGEEKSNGKSNGKVFSSEEQNGAVYGHHWVPAFGDRGGDRGVAGGDVLADAGGVQEVPAHGGNYPFDPGVGVLHSRGNDARRADSEAEVGEKYHGRQGRDGRPVDGSGAFGPPGAVAEYHGDHDQSDHGNWADGQQQSGEAKKALILGKDAPPKDKPMVMVFGGSFNPMHMDHVAAAQKAVKLARDAGYKVDKIIMAPSADKLLAKKLGSGAYPLSERVEIGKASVAGLPDIEVSGGAAVEAENFQGKLRRTQLADWAQKENPHATIVNVTGEDQATGPGHEPPGFPSIYVGSPGTNHAGYYYLALARPEGGISSTQIRKLIAEGKEIPPELMAPDAVKRLPSRKQFHLLGEHDQDDHGNWSDKVGDKDSAWEEPVDPSEFGVSSKNTRGGHGQLIIKLPGKIGPRVSQKLSDELQESLKTVDVEQEGDLLKLWLENGVVQDDQIEFAAKIVRRWRDQARQYHGDHDQSTHGNWANGWEEGSTGDSSDWRSKDANEMSFDELNVAGQALAAEHEHEIGRRYKGRRWTDADVKKKLGDLVMTSKLTGPGGSVTLETRWGGGEFKHKTYHGDHDQSTHGNWADGSMTTAADKAALQKHLVDYVAERELEGPGAVPISSVIPGIKSIGYLDVPGIEKMHALMGIPNPTLNTDIREYASARDRLFRAQPPADVPMAELTLTQPRVNEKRAAALSKLPDQLSKRVQVVHKEGRYYLMNGHHRIAAQHMAGMRVIPANVLDLDAKFNKLGGFYIVYHNPGGQEHDQSTHGNWADGGKDEERGSDRTAFEDINTVAATGDDVRRSQNRYAAHASRIEKELGVHEHNERLREKLKGMPQTKSLHGFTPTEVQGKYAPDGAYSSERAALHRAIVDGLNSEATPVDNPTITIMGGVSGSGKSTIRKTLGFSNTVKVDPDEIRAQLPEYQQQGGWIASATQDETDDISNALLLRAASERKNIVFDATLKSYDKFNDRIAEFKKLGYNVQMIYVYMPMNDALKGVIGRYKDTGRFVDPNYVASQDHQNRTTFERLKSKANTWRLYDNTGMKAVLVEEGGGG